MRLAVYTDYGYTSDGTRRYAQRAFAVFLEALREHVDRLVLVGRFDPNPAISDYPLDDETELVELPHFESYVEPRSVARSMLLSVTRCWRLLDEVDTVWVLGPYPQSILLALMAALRGRRLVLGVRQDMPEYVRKRRPDRRWMHVSADIMEATWKLLARRYPVVVVGPELERKYRARGARSVLATAVSLVSEGDLAQGASAGGNEYGGELTLLSVGRLDAEKNPLLLAEVIAGLAAGPRSWRMVVCGDGPLQEPLLERLEQLGVRDRVELVGYVPLHGGLLDLYRSSSAFLHVSLTEGFPQVLVEAFACALPVVATAVGGVRAAADGAAILIEPSDAGSAIAALERVAADPALRERLIEAGLQRAREATIETTTTRLANFLATAT